MLEHGVGSHVRVEHPFGSEFEPRVADGVDRVRLGEVEHVWHRDVLDADTDHKRDLGALGDLNAGLGRLIDDLPGVELVVVLFSDGADRQTDEGELF